MRVFLIGEVKNLLDAQLGQVVAQRDAEPADNLRPTTSWVTGERIEDNYGIAVPTDLAPGAYVLEVGQVAIEGQSAELRRHEGVRKSYLGY